MSLHFVGGEYMRKDSVLGWVTMRTPNMDTITSSLERSLRNCSLNQTITASPTAGFGSSSSSDSPENHRLSVSSDNTLELNSQISLPYHWEQCLDIKSGEIYYLNWRTGERVKEDPRRTGAAECSGGLYWESESSCDSEGSSSEYSASSSKGQQQQHDGRDDHEDKEESHVLVVTGCKNCLMYFMVPKHVQDCPKCTALLLRFDRSSSNQPT